MNELLPRHPEEQVEASGIVKGLAVAIVTRNKDDSGQVRLKVRYPWHAKKEESYWARLCTPMAGKNRGLYFLPKVGDEVVVGFDRGDIRFPFVLAALWNGEDSWDEPNSDGKAELHRIRTQDNNQLTLRDGSQGYAELCSKHGNVLRMDDQVVKLVDKNRNEVLIDVVKNTIKITSKTSVQIESAQIELRANGALTLSAGTTLTIQGALVKIN